MKKGDLVRIVRDRGRVSDFKSDLFSDFADRSISGADHDALIKAIEEGEPFRITAVIPYPHDKSVSLYEISLVSPPLDFGYQLEAEDLESIP